MDIGGFGKTHGLLRVGDKSRKDLGIYYIRSDYMIMRNTGGRWGLTRKRPEGTFEGDGNTLYLDWSVNYIGVYICQYSSNRVLKICSFTGCKYFHKKEKKKEKNVKKLV